MALALPLIVFVVATAGMVLLVEPFLAWYYQWAWWSYIFTVDALNRRLSGRSLLRDEPRRFFWLAAVSVVLWTFFEALNLRLGNWYYVMDHPVRVIRWTGGVVAFATVLPGLYETEALLRNVGVLRSVRFPPLRWGPPLKQISVAFGLTCFALPLVWPDVFFPLTWLSFIFVLEPWNLRFAPESRLRELARGDAGPLLRWLLAGLVCGFLWEAWNYWARVKWMYTVPGFEDLKLFEMPVTGFLGFPPFALQCVAIVACLDGLRERLRTRSSSLRRAAVVTASGLSVLLILVVFRAGEDITVDSTFVPVAGLQVLPAKDRRVLSQAGLDGPERLCRALGDEAALESWSARTGIAADTLREHRERVALVLHQGLGDARARELERLGIRTRRDLDGWEAGRVAAALQSGGARGPTRFLERRARVWLSRLPRD